MCIVKNSVCVLEELKTGSIIDGVMNIVFTLFSVLCPPS